MSTDVDASAILQGRIELLRKQPRHLDSRPKVLKLQHLNPTTQYGITQQFILTYNAIQEELKEQPCSINLNGIISQCDYIPFCVCKSLILMGITKDKNLADICSALFKKILGSISRQTDHGVVISKDALETFIGTIQTHNDYSRALVNGICFAAFPKQYLKLYWRQISYCGNGYYTNAIKAGERYLDSHTDVNSTKALDKVLITAYNDAKKDKAFLHCVDATVATKPLIGMMYLTFLDDNTIFQLKDNVKDEEGFM